MHPDVEDHLLARTVPGSPNYDPDLEPFPLPEFTKPAPGQKTLWDEEPCPVCGNTEPHEHLTDPADGPIAYKFLNTKLNTPPPFIPRPSQGCEFIPRPYTEIQGWFEFESVYDFLVRNTPQNGTFIECGAWRGRSSAYLCDATMSPLLQDPARFPSPHDTLTTIQYPKFIPWIVDSWEGSTNEPDMLRTLSTNNIYEEFLANMQGRKYYHLKQESLVAADLLHKSLSPHCPMFIDTVFIDMDHSYESVKRDLSIWYPLVKRNGWLGGHDYGIFPGVARAVDEFFHPRKVLVMDHCWLIQK